MIRVFAQGPAGLDLPRLLGAARAHFEAVIEVESAGPPPVILSATLKISSVRHGYSGSFQVGVRPATSTDYEHAEQAEVAGKAAGMAALARRCPNVWEVSPAEDLGNAAALNLCAVLASVALGPILPPDLSSLLGVRSAMERLERMLGPRTLLR